MNPTWQQDLRALADCVFDAPALMDFVLLLAARRARHRQAVDAAEHILEEARPWA